MSAPKPYRLSLAFLERSELWLIPQPECESHPLLIGLYLPPDCAELIMRILCPFRAADSPASSSGARPEVGLRLLE
jgi:hypothetical protein